jgi:pyruvate/2-oxoglutarate dehydrogenase complex dihydrolipoamide acyltransferase (E2) component
MKMPKLGDTADDVVVIEWLVEVGERVVAGQPVLRVETSKVNTDVVAPVGGSVTELLVAPEDEVSAGAPILVVEGD